MDNANDVPGLISIMVFSMFPKSLGSRGEIITEGIIDDIRALERSSISHLYKNACRLLENG